MSDLARARTAKKWLAGRLQGQEGVVGIGLARDGDDYRLRVNVRDDASVEQVPQWAAGVPVQVVVVGRIGPQR